jgi:hypothetical protein
MKPSGEPYKTKPEYLLNMSKLDTFGTSSELMAAGEIFRYAFQVFRNGILLATFEEGVEGINKLMFSGGIIGGHFKVLIPNLIQPIPPSLQWNPVSSDSMDCDPQMLSSSVTQFIWVLSFC